MVETLISVNTFLNAFPRAEGEGFIKTADAVLDGKLISQPEIIIPVDKLPTDTDARKRLMELESEFRKNLPDKMIEIGDNLGPHNPAIFIGYEASVLATVVWAYSSYNFNFLQETAIAVGGAFVNATAFAIETIFSKNLMSGFIKNRLVKDFKEDINDFRRSERLV